MDKTQEQLVKEAQERKEFLVRMLADVPQANIDLMCVLIQGDKQKRSASYWMAEGFSYFYKYVARLRKQADEREALKQKAFNENLFNAHIAMYPPKDEVELLTIMLRFGVCPQVSVGKVKTNIQAKQEAEEEARKAAELVA